MDFIKLYWIPLFLILVGICIPLFKLISDNKSSETNKGQKHALWQGASLVVFGVYLLVTKMFLSETLTIISWLFGTLIVAGILRRLKEKKSDKKGGN